MSTWNCRILAFAIMLFTFNTPLFAQIGYLNFEALYWDRSQDTSGIDLFNSAADTLDTGAQLPFNLQGGNRVTFGYDNREYAIEGSYLIIDDWSTTFVGVHANALNFANNAAANNLNFVSAVALAANANGTGFDALSTLVRMDHESQLQQAEGSVRFDMGWFPWIRGGAGFAYVNLDERSILSLTGNANGNAFVPVVGGFPAATQLAAATDVGIVEFESKVQNNLYGSQIIADMLFYEGDYTFVEGSVKTGLYYNNIKGTIVERVTEVSNAAAPETSQFQHTDQKDELAFVSNLKLRSGLKLRENIRVWLGYEVMIMTGVATAVDQYEQLRLTTPTTIRYDIGTSTVFAHGGNGGLEVSW